MKNIWIPILFVMIFVGCGKNSNSFGPAQLLGVNAAQLDTNNDGTLDGVSIQPMPSPADPQCSPDDNWILNDKCEEETCELAVDENLLHTEVISTCTNLVVTSMGVSSARIWLNGEKIFNNSEFHNDPAVTLTKGISLHSGTNLICTRLEGSPGDQMTVEIVSCDTETPQTLFSMTFTRETGRPKHLGGTF